MRHKISSAMEAITLVAKAKAVHSSNTQLLRELQSMRNEEERHRHQLMNGDAPLVKRWCQEADAFVRSKKAMERSDEGVAEDIDIPEHQTKIHLFEVKTSTALRDVERVSGEFHSGAALLI